MQTPPTVGRIVHFFPSGSKEPQAALVIAVWNPNCVNLSVCNSAGTWLTKTSVTQGALEEDTKERWDWPARA
jgi:hypothetical protein